MYISIEDVEKILEIMKKFPDATSFKLVQDGHSGIGSITSIIVCTEINGLDGEFKIEISGVESW
jgi:hypothetical protein